MNIVDPILFRCQRQPSVAAICCPGIGIGLISYRRLANSIHNVCQRLLALGLARQTTVAVHIPDVIFHTVVVLALARLGIVSLSVDQNDFAAIRPDALITTEKISSA